MKKQYNYKGYAIDKNQHGYQCIDLQLHSYDSLRELKDEIDIINQQDGEVVNLFEDSLDIGDIMRYEL